ncbi:amino acid adenylation domain-containing protein [Fulvivirga ulvae]|uniref:non-ribosomal peptide synthetase n=1 Tax=Fulvivirga ulvae TaxID=2904245 RepID=UPI001F310739|nr:non-ribosomal peptide synthetase [Fulvivirga ulvae]UII31861.1 amino acid adenylation domain-containing protein [Fulvivirga ulvae]
MDALNIITEAHESGISLFLNEEGELKVNVPKGTQLSPALLEKIKAGKEELKSFLKKNLAVAKSVKKGLTIKKVNRGELDKIPLSSSQESLWFIDQIEGGLAYHIPFSIEITEDFEKEYLARAYSELINRHEPLRTVIKEKGGIPYQLVLDKGEWKFEEIEGGEFSKESFDELLKEQLLEPFNLSEGPLLRAKLVKYSDRYIFLIVVHHIIFDGWSTAIFGNELSQLYFGASQNSSSALKPLEIEYADYAVWEKARLTDDFLKKYLSFWEEELENTEPTTLQGDFSRPQVLSGSGDIIEQYIDRQLSEGLKDLAAKQNTSLYILLLSVFNLLIARYARKDDVVVGSPIANRNLPELEPLIGFFTNTLVLRNRIQNDLPFNQWLKDVSGHVFDAFEHQDIPLIKIVEHMKSDRDATSMVLFNIMFSLANYPEPGKKQIGELKELEEITSQFDITLRAKEEPQGFNLSVNYSTDLFLRETVEQFLGQYITLLEQIVADPEAKLSSLSLMNSGEQQALQSIHYNAEPLPKIHETVMEKFDRQVLLTPDHVALYERDEEVTYKELQARSNALSHRLHAKGVRPGDIVGVSMERSSDLITTIFGILKAGCAYLPIDWTQPDSRREYILDHTGAQYLVADKTTGSFYKSFEAVTVVDYEHLITESSTSEEENPAHESGIEDLAYIIYTSGSTGTPKGVMVEHRSLTNLIETMQAQYPLEGGDSYLLKTNVVFDVSCSELFGWFVSGGSLAILPQGEESDPIAIKDALVRYGVSHVNFVPSMLGLFLEEIGRKGGSGLESLRYIISAGEPLARNTVDYFNRLGLSARLENLYGPTEATIYATGYSTSSHKGLRSVSIGKPLRGVKAYVLDSANQLAGLGVPGELCLGGIALARGYYNNPELTSEKFVNNPYDGESGSRLYKTGDLVRWLPDGNLEYLGRIDEQVKLRGYRIELGEITHWLKELEGVAEGIVQLRGEGENQYLVGYYVSEEELLTKDIREYLQAHLPSYMVPEYYVRIEELPLLPSGKIDKKKLPEPNKVNQDVYIAPADEIEEELVQAWSILLGTDSQQISTTANFFKNGGHSLLATRMISMIQDKFEVSFPVRVVFQYPTIQSLAKYIRIINKEAAPADEYDTIDI